jgi:hypothetical protein
MVKEVEWRVPGLCVGNARFYLRWGKSDGVRTSRTARSVIRRRIHMPKVTVVKASKLGTTCWRPARLFGCKDCPHVYKICKLPEGLKARVKMFRAQLRELKLQQKLHRQLIQDRLQETVLALRGTGAKEDKA